VAAGATLVGVQSWEQQPEEFAAVTRVLAAIGVHDAEIRRRLAPVAVRLGAPKPSYFWVRRIAGAERRRLAAHRDAIEDVLDSLLPPYILRPWR